MQHLGTQKLLHLILIRLGKKEIFPLWFNAKRAASRKKQHTSPNAYKQ